MVRATRTRTRAWEGTEALVAVRKLVGKDDVIGKGMYLMMNVWLYAFTVYSESGKTSLVGGWRFVSQYC